MAVKVSNIVYNYVRKKLAKNANDRGGITKLPQSMDIESGMQQIFKILKKRNLNPVSAEKIIKNEDDLARFIAESAALDKDKKLMRDYQQKMNNTVQEIMDKMAKGIPVNPLDRKKLEASGFKVDVSKELFKGFEPKVIKGGKSPGITSLDLAKELEELTNKNLKERGLGNIKLGDELPPPKNKKADVDPELQKSEDRKKEFKDFENRNPDEKAMGGRIGFNKGGIFKFLSENNPLQAYKKYLESVKRRSIEGDFKSLAPELGAISAGGIFVNRKMKKILEEGNELQKEKFLQEFIEELDKDPFYKKYPDMKDKAIEKYTERMFGDKKAMGGRIGFKEGSGMSRRTFLKLMGGLASLPFVGKLFKGAKVASKAAPVVETTSGVPAYFPKLVEKIKLLGDDVTRTNAIQERQVVTKYKDYEMTENLSTGNIEIEKTNEAMGTFVDMSGEVQTYDGIASKEIIQYSPPETIIGKNNKPVKVPAQYEETTARSTGFDGKLEDFDDGLESIDEILEEVGETKIKKAGGGLAYMLGE